MITAVHHVQMTIPKGAEDTARAFYCDLLGLQEVEKPESLNGRGGLWLQLGALQVHIGTEDGVDRAATKAHVAYQVDDVAAWQARLAEHGIQILGSVPIPGYSRFEFRDPFGNRVEFIQPLSDIAISADTCIIKGGVPDRLLTVLGAGLAKDKIRTLADSKPHG